VSIVFPVMADPVDLNVVNSLARPGGNIKDFMASEFSLSGKWLELLKQVAPDVTRAAVIRDPVMGSGTSQYAAVQAMAPSLKVEVNPVNARDAGKIERAVEMPCCRVCGPSPILSNPAYQARSNDPPTGSDWIHEIKCDGFWLLARRGAVTVRHLHITEAKAGLSIM
jgi:hypothetical protein